MVTVYSKPNCMQCNFTKKYLDDKGISYKSVDIFEDASALEHVQALGFQSVPVVEADDEPAFNGFRPDLLAKLA
ncbi:glutaredoxin-like protein NrdH [Eremococcus coleocola]|uniref:Glutaredoxin-like protein NrdH n=1 Tax=Eremococcus coleocola ACS-139-V-Col8 TaxID=908337 RepID=E4KQ12_9LACT|nr:glutaredoxin-like protein NrdH [Eremococcus coleocola]EFR31064.1 glutaredoxin [Eremococcus coleocola ACS-139-V-Col8]